MFVGYVTKIGETRNETGELIIGCQKMDAAEKERNIRQKSLQYYETISHKNQKTISEKKIGSQHKTGK